MKRTFFTALEQHSSQEPLALSNVINELAFNEQGLIPVITQDVSSNEILMFAWMNLDALKQTIATKRVTYW
ncbi:MAG: phosphoribosyl-AMP cyclohydrolase, partial [Pseudomonadales bacterium]